MLERNITITLEKAKEWYNSGNESLKEVALQAFSKKELSAFDFTKVKTFKDALFYICKYNPWNYDYNSIIETIDRLRIVSKASAAMFMLNIVRKVLHTGYYLHLARNESGQKFTWYPSIKFAAKMFPYHNELKRGEYKEIGEFKSEGVIYGVFSTNTNISCGVGLGSFFPSEGIGGPSAHVGFLGCATEEIARHFGKYFGMLIMEAMYGDIEDFEIIKS